MTAIPDLHRIHLCWYSLLYSYLAHLGGDYMSILIDDKKT